MLITQNDISLPEDKRPARFADLELFKMLLQPHFLFNSLNNLYALSVKQSDKTTEAIAGLSELLEKVVSCARQDYIPLENEVELIKDYIRLEQIWLGETNFLVDFQVSGQTEGVDVPPLLLYTFVENCFKHGIRRCENGAWLNIRIDVKKNNLYFKARNQVPVMEVNHEQNEEQSTGLGVLAAKELLERKCTGKFELKNGLNGHVYFVDLRIKQAGRLSA